jgi:ribosomal protein S18 acetylase RimI-like enzyme
MPCDFHRQAVCSLPVVVQFFAKEILMAAISNALTSAQETQLRMFDARRDLDAVADLVEVCFSDTLDPDGRDYLLRMRSAARSPSWLGWSAAAEWSGAAMTGYVWIQDNRLVGNVSMVPYFLKGRRFFMIANVAVHPDYRRQGIARAMTEAAIAYARQKGAPAAWLQVREENEGAQTLYRSLGFQERVRRTTWLAEAEESAAQPPTGVKITSPAGRYWAVQRAWLQRSYQDDLAWHMQFRLFLLQPGLLGWLVRLMYDAEIKQWAAQRGDRLLAVVAWQQAWGHSNLLWLAAPPEADCEVVGSLLVHARRNAPSHRAVLLEYPARQHAEAIQEAGFQEQQTLVWMNLEFSSR